MLLPLFCCCCLPLLFPASFSPSLAADLLEAEAFLTALPLADLSPLALLSLLPPLLVFAVVADLLFPLPLLLFFAGGLDLVSLLCCALVPFPSVFFALVLVKSFLVVATAALLTSSLLTAVDLVDLLEEGFDRPPLGGAGVSFLYFCCAVAWTTKLDSINQEGIHVHTT